MLFFARKNRKSEVYYPNLMLNRIKLLEIAFLLSFFIHTWIFKGLGLIKGVHQSSEFHGRLSVSSESTLRDSKPQYST